MDKKQLKKLGRKEDWFKGLFILIFFAVSYIVAFVTLFVVIFQFISTVITKKPNEHLGRLGQSLSIYFYQIVRYLTYCSDEKPFPFNEWPAPADLEPHAAKTTRKKQ